MSAPAARTADRCTPLTEAWVPTGMKAGVRMTPRAVAISPARAAPSVANRRKLKSCSESMRRPVALRQAYHEFRRRNAALFHAPDRLLHRFAEVTQSAGALQDIEPLLGGQAAERLLDLDRFRHMRMQLFRERDVDSRGKQQRHRVDRGVFVQHRISPSTRPPVAGRFAARDDRSIILAT